ncbi:MAG TPA: hypothetical protein VL992_14910 [Tepidisphaeraceae bacterium]|nr:hypothetical protein [Tepidisphaeraceae bacterium]
MRLFVWLIFGGLLCWAALCWNGEEVENMFVKIAFFFHDLFLK